MFLVAVNLLLMIVMLTRVKAENEFNHCIRGQNRPGFINCLGQQTLSVLHNIDKADNYSFVDGLLMVRPDNVRSRTFADFFTDDPTDFRFVC